MIAELTEVLGNRFMFWYGFICIALFGVCIGSFLNVVIIRLERHESLYKQSSHCMTCGNKIKWYDNIPIISYLVLRGKCRKCGSKISIQYPLVESLNMLLWVFVYCYFGYSIWTIIYCLMTSALICIGKIDYDTLEIEPHLQIFLLLLGIISVIIDKNHLSHLLGAVSVSGFLMIFYVLTAGQGLGLGDVKLMMFLGLIVGLKEICIGFLIGAILAVVIQLIVKKVTGESKFAFGPYLSLGTYIGLFVGERFVNWYLELFI